MPGELAKLAVHNILPTAGAWVIEKVGSIHMYMQKTSNCSQVLYTVKHVHTYIIKAWADDVKVCRLLVVPEDSSL